MSESLTENRSKGGASLPPCDSSPFEWVRQGGRALSCLFNFFNSSQKQSNEI